MTPQLTDKYMVTIAERLTSAYARIAVAAKNAQRNSNEITLLAVSKPNQVPILLLPTSMANANLVSLMFKRL